MDVYLLRHAQCDANLTNQLAVDAYNSLTKQGHQQAQEIVFHLQKLNPCKVFCSTMARTRDTIRPFLQYYDQEAIYTELLAEGQLVLDKSMHETIEPKYTDSEMGSIPVVGEEPGAFLKRAELAVDMVRGSGLDRVLIVSHGHMIRELINLYVGNADQRIRFPHENVGLTSITLGDICSLNYVNRPLCSGVSNGRPDPQSFLQKRKTGI